MSEPNDRTDDLTGKPDPDLTRPTVGAPEPSPFGPTYTAHGMDYPVAEPDAPPPDVPGYQVLDEIGRGGMGVVYRAVQDRVNRVVALKMVLAGEFAGATARTRFLAEAEVVAKLQHPNIVQLYEFKVHNGLPYFTLEFVDGGTLAAKLARRPLPAGEAAALVETLAWAVQYAHDRGVIHRDLKPGNVLLQPRPGAPNSGPPSGGSHSTHKSLHGDATFGTLSCVVRDLPVIPKITDFGLAKSTAGGSGLTASGAVMGTPSYMAPEQARGDGKEITPRTDVYALGAVLYEALTGRPPFQAASPMDTVMQVLHQDPVPPRRLQPKVARDLETICLKCLAKDPAKRYPTAAELADDLARHLNGEAIRARPVGPIERTVRWARRRPAAAALVGVTVAAGLVILVGGWLLSAALLSSLEVTRQSQELAEAKAREAEAAAAEAEVQKRAAEANAAEANRQKAEVAANLQKRLDVVDDIVINMDGRLEAKTGMTAIRREFLDEVRKLSDQLLLDSPDDPSILRQAGRVYRGVADLAYRTGDNRESDAAYAKALAYERKLVDRYPDQTDALLELTRTTASRAWALWGSNRLEPAVPAFQDAIALLDQLAARPDQPRAAVKALLNRFYLANVLEELGRKPEAVALYREALARQEKLAAERKDDADLLEDLGRTATSLALAVEDADPEEAVRLLRKARDTHRRAAELVPDRRTYRTNVSDAYHDLYDVCLRHDRDADLAALAREYAEDPTDTRYGPYNAACYFALAAAAAKAKPDRAEAYAKEAIALLEKDLERGVTFDHRVHLMNDTDLEALRDRPDYQALIEQLDRRFPGRPVTPADLLTSLQSGFDTAQANYARLTNAAMTVADKKRAERAKPDFAGFSARVLKLAGEVPNTPAAVEATIWVLETGSTVAKVDPSARPICDQALTRLEKALDRPDFGNACRVLAYNPSARGDKLLKAAASSHKDTDVRGLSAYALGISLAQQAEAAKAGTELQARLTREAEDQLEKVAKEFDQVPHQNSTLGASARRKLYQIRSLSVGRKAREITGTTLDGKPMTLSQHKGKVTLVFFWASWCGYSRQVLPYTLAWSAKYKDRSFALVGVNCDDDKAVAQRAVAKAQLPYPSWWDGGATGGRINSEWLIDGFPTLYLIGPDGVIRDKWDGKPEQADVEAAVDKLVSQTERKK
jgi:serine/threonine protein kinase/thiol-disulfide isomerase/thioredoxin